MQQNRYAPKLYCVGVTEAKRNCTVSGYKRNDAFRELRTSILAGVLDKALFWAVELHASKCGPRLWETLSLLASREVNMTNPNLPALAWQSFDIHHTVTNGDLPKEEPYHDHQVLRNHLTQLVAVLTLSPKAKLPTLVTWKKEVPLDLMKNLSRIKRRDLSPIGDIVKISDAPEVYHPLNEIDVALGKSGMDASAARHHFVWWLSWLVELERRSKAVIYCAKRAVPDIPEKCKGHVCWVIWQIVFKSLERQQAGLGLMGAVRNLYKLFRTGYTQGKRRSRIPYLIHAGLLVIGSTPPIHFGLPLFAKPDSVLVACANINSYYQRIAEQQMKSTLVTGSNQLNEILHRPVLYVPLKNPK